jgi:hypothetical protein
MAWAGKAGDALAMATLETVQKLAMPTDFGSWLLTCVAFESAETFSPTVKNLAGSGAIGLIQFMPKTTIPGLGYTVEQVEAMSAVEQMLGPVYEYFKPYAGRIRGFGDMYMAILAPHYIGASGDAILFSGGTPYRQNSRLDENSDGKITKDEAADLVRLRLAKGWLPGYMGNVK